MTELNINKQNSLNPLSSCPFIFDIKVSTENKFEVTYGEDFIEIKLKKRKLDYDDTNTLPNKRFRVELSDITSINYQNDSEDIDDATDLDDDTLIQSDNQELNNSDIINSDDSDITDGEEPIQCFNCARESITQCTRCKRPVCLAESRNCAETYKCDSRLCVNCLKISKYCDIDDDKIKYAK